MKRALVLVFMLFLIAVLWSVRHQHRDSPVDEANLRRSDTRIRVSPTASPSAQVRQSFSPLGLHGAGTRPSPGERTVEVEHLGSGGPPEMMKRDQLEAALSENAAILQEIVAKDIADGINAEVREKEAGLRSVAFSLQRGMKPGQAVELLGIPDTVTIPLTNITSHGTEWRLKRVAPTNGTTTITNAIFGYWPRVGVPFNGKNGQGYEVLYLRFDGEGNLVRWQWERPCFIYGGSLTTSLKQRQYWEGVHEISPPPPMRGGDF